MTKDMIGSNDCAKTSEREEVAEEMLRAAELRLAQWQEDEDLQEWAKAAAVMVADLAAIMEGKPWT